MKSLGPLLGCVLGLSTTVVSTAQADWWGVNVPNPASYNNFSFNNGVKLYAGAGVGYGLQGDTCTMPFFDGQCDDAAASWKLFGGARLNPMFGAELSYLSVGEASKKGSINGTSASVRNKVSGYQMNGIAYLPVGFLANTEVFGKAGVMFWERDTRTSLGETLRMSNDDGVSPMTGIGAQYRLDANLHLRGEWEHIFNTGSGSDHETDADSYSIGLLYSTL